MTVNYVVACWTGPRRGDTTSGLHYLKKHIAFLENIKHKLNQITVVVSKYEDNISEVFEYSSGIKQIQETPVKWLIRDNLGMSYGAFSDAYAEYRTEFDYYIFMEDDYVCVHDGFDDILVGLIESYPRCGFMCQLSGDALITNGIARTISLEDIFISNGKIPSYRKRRNQYSGSGQRGFTSSFINAGWELRDFSDRYKTPFSIYWDNSIREYSPDQTEYLIKPAQMV